MDGKRFINKVLATIFKYPNSYAGEDVVEISYHITITSNRQQFNQAFGKVAVWHN